MIVVAWDDIVPFKTEFIVKSGSKGKTERILVLGTTL